MPDGSVFAMTNVAPFLGIIALALFASNLGHRIQRHDPMQFVTEPNRIKVLAGNFAALASFVNIGSRQRWQPVSASRVCTLPDTAVVCPAGESISPGARRLTRPARLDWSVLGVYAPVPRVSDSGTPHG